MATAGRQRVAVAVLAGSGMLTALQFTLIVPALPEIPSALGVSANDASWMVTVTLLTGTVGTPIVTRLADMHGKRRLLILSLALLVVGSVLAAVTMTFAGVLIGRALQGFASAIIPIGMSLLRDQLPGDRANSAIALMSATLGIGSAAGLPLSGVLSQWGGLESLFWFSAVAGCVFLVAISLLVTESSAPRATGRFDLGGAAVLAVGLTALLLVISKAIEWGPWSPRILIAGLVALAAFAAWVPMQLRHATPVVDLRTSFSRVVLLTNTASFFAATGMFGNHLLTMQEALAPTATGYGLGLDTIAGGLTMVPSALAMVALAPVSGRLLNRFGGRTVLTLGSVTMAAAFFLRLVVHDSVLAVVVGAVIAGAGTAFAFSAMPSLIMGAVRPTESAAANGINTLVRSLSGAVVTAVFALIISGSSVTIGGTDYLSDAGLALALVYAGACSGLAAVLAVLLPRRPSSRPMP